MAKLITSGAGYSGTVGGTVGVLGTNDIDVIFLADAPGKVNFDGSFNRGGDFIVLPNPSTAYTVVRTSASVIVFDDGDTKISIPVGTKGAAIQFSNGEAILKYTGQVVLGEQIVTATTEPVTSPLGTKSKLPGGAGSTADLIMAADEPVIVGGNVRIFGTNGADRVTVAGVAGKVSFDGSFNRGGDTIVLKESLSKFQGQAIASNAILTNETQRINLPVGSNPTTILFNGEVSLLNYNTTLKSFQLGNRILSSKNGSIAGPMQESIFSPGAVIPSFKSIYDSFDGYGGGLYFTNMTAAQINGKASLIFFIQKTLATPGLNVTTPVVNRQVIIQLENDGTFTNATKALLGNEFYSLNGQAGDVLVTSSDLSNGNPIILIAGNAEDGRAINTPLSDDLVTSQIQIPNSNGTYTTMDIGREVFGGKGSLQYRNGSYYIGSFQNGQTNFRSSDDGAVGKYYDAFYRYEGGKFVVAGYAPTDPYGYAFVSDTQLFTIATYFPVKGAPPVGTAFAIANLMGVDWKLSSYIAPYTPVELRYVTSAGNEVSTKELWNVTTQIEDKFVFDGIFAIVGMADFIKGGAVEVITAINANSITPRSDGRFYQVDAKPYAFYDFWNVVDGRIVSASITLVGRSTNVNEGDVQVIDIQRDGLPDLVINNWNQGGRPDIYLNTGAGSLYRVPYSQLPDSGLGPSNGILFDINSDGFLDIVYQPYAAQSFNTEVQPKVFLGSTDLTIYENIVLESRNGGEQIATWSGNDLIYDTGAAPITTIDLGSGWDTAVYRGKASEYSISFEKNGTLKIKGNGIADTIANVEEIKFSDLSLLISNISSYFGTYVTDNSNGSFFG